MLSQIHVTYYAKKNTPTKSYFLQTYITTDNHKLHSKLGLNFEESEMSEKDVMYLVFCNK